MKSDAMPLCLANMRLANWRMPKHSLTKLMLGGVLALGAAAPGLAQSNRLIPPMPVAGAAKPPAVTAQAAAPAATPTPPKEWSGEARSSGPPGHHGGAIPAGGARFESRGGRRGGLPAQRHLSR